MKHINENKLLKIVNFKDMKSWSDPDKPEIKPLDTSYIDVIFE